MSTAPQTTPASAGPSRREIIQRAQQQGLTPSRADVDAALVTDDPLAAIVTIVRARRSGGKEPPAPESESSPTVARPAPAPAAPTKRAETLPPSAKQAPSPAAADAAQALLLTLVELTSGPQPSFSVATVQARLSGPQNQAARDFWNRLVRGLKNHDLRLRSGRKIDSHHAAAVWLLQELGRVVALAEGRADG